jgi:hypothetical protein
LGLAPENDQEPNTGKPGVEAREPDQGGAPDLFQLYQED